MRDRILLKPLAVLGAVGGALVFVASLATFVLAASYRPSGGQAWPVLAASNSSRFSDWWSVVQTLALVAFGLVAVVTIVAGWTRAQRATTARPTASRVIGAIAGAGAMVAAVVALATKPLVQWDQLALWAVTVGSDMNGYWVAAFDDSVRFILIGGSEVSQGQYATMLIVHLAAPVVAAALFVVAIVCSGVLRDIRGDRPSTAHVLDQTGTRLAAPNAELNRSHQTTTDR